MAEPFIVKSWHEHQQSNLRGLPHMEVINSTKGLLFEFYPVATSFYLESRILHKEINMENIFLEN